MKKPEFWVSVNENKGYTLICPATSAARKEFPLRNEPSFSSTQPWIRPLRLTVANQQTGITALIELQCLLFWQHMLLAVSYPSLTNQFEKILYACMDNNKGRNQSGTRVSILTEVLYSCLDSNRFLIVLNNLCCQTCQREKLLLLMQCIFYLLQTNHCCCCRKCTLYYFLCQYLQPIEKLMNRM